MSLRIAHVTNEPFGLNTANGVQQSVYCLARAQGEIGQAVAVFSRDDHGRNFFGSGQKVGRHHAGAPPHTKRSIRQALLSKYFEASLADEVLAWRPDVVHFHSVHIAVNVAMAAYLVRAGIPYCVTAHGGLFPAALRRRRLKKLAFSIAFERRYLNEALFIHAVSPHETEVIRRHGVHRPIVVLPNGLPADAGAMPTRPGALYDQAPSLRGQRIFMFVGRLDSWQKGLDLLIEAFATARLSGAALVLVGPDWFGSRRQLAALAERLGISSQLAFLGSAFGDDRANLFAAADVFVHPSRWEGLSLSVLAAAAAGKACLITRDADPMGELERAQAAILVEPTVASITAGLTDAATRTNQELERMGANARRVAEAHFSWTSIAAKLVEAYTAGVRSRFSESSR